MDYTTLWLEIAALALTSSGGSILIKHLIDVGTKRRAEKKKRDLLDGMRSIASTYASMERLKDSGCINRVLLLEVSNGGHMPKAGSKMFARAINAKHDDQTREAEMMQRYESITIDDRYISMCIQIQSNPSEPYRIVTTEHPRCLLTDFYKMEDVSYSEVYHIYTDVNEKKMFILSIATEGKGSERFERDSVRAFINVEISEIRSQFEKFRKG